MATGSIEVVLTSKLPLEGIQVDYRYGSVVRRFTMRTDGNGAASHPLMIPKQAAGLLVSVSATMSPTEATCTTSVFVPALPTTTTVKAHPRTSQALGDEPSGIADARSAT